MEGRYQDIENNFAQHAQAHLANLTPYQILDIGQGHANNVRNVLRNFTRLIRSSTSRPNQPSA